MKNIFSALKLSLLCLVLFAVIYPSIINGVAYFAPNKGNGETVSAKNVIVGYKNIGQAFNQDNYFWSRPSAVNYNAAGSAGSNKGPSNEQYLLEVQSRIDTFLIHHPYLQKNQIPSEMVTASGSGLDPDISVQSALIQIQRIAKNRNLKEKDLEQLVANQTQKPLLNLFGPAKINVLELNIALENLK